MDGSSPIVFYDIASGPAPTCFAPNPWKTRYALNFKTVAYKTHWVPLPAVKSTRLGLDAPPNRILPDGSDFYTLPVIVDPSTATTVGDTFDIATYLDATYPHLPTLFPAKHSLGLYRAFNAQVDAIFTNHVALLLHGMPLDPASAAESRTEFSRRAGGASWEDLGVRGQARVEMFEKLKGAVAGLVKPYRQDESGPYLDGATPSYADIIVGAWLQFAKATTTAEEWEDLCSWHDGLCGKIHRALEEWAEVK